MNLNNRFAIGTAQFGFDYGISNQTGRVPEDEIKAILDYSYRNGINTLDTAINYGMSEEVLGHIGISKWKVMTKLPKLSQSTSSINNLVLEYIESSLNHLKLAKLDTVLLHAGYEINNEEGEAIYSALLKLKERGIVNNIGVSIYDPNDAIRCIYNYEVDVIQIPFNIFDRRLLNTNLYDLACAANIKIHVRSVFLQGLLLINGLEQLDYFKKWSQLWSEWQNYLLINNISPLCACLSFLSQYKEIEKIIIGIDNIEQLKEILNTNIDTTLRFPDSLSTNDINLINPSEWKQTVK